MRREIQGLRAVAVLLVVLFHLWPNRLPGGYVGVDVFFVISGFLITSHLLRELARTGTVGLAQFWARRIRRLIPAAYVVLVASAVGVLLWVPRLAWQQFFGEILAAALYVENWALALGAVDYLAADNQPSPAQHYWTLSAEEQFYLVWPLLVLAGVWLAVRLARRRGSVVAPRRAVLGVLAVVTLVSLGYSLWITAHDPAWAYFVTPARAWEFGAGALLAFAPTVSGRHAGRAVLGWASLVVLVSCSVVLDKETPMPGTAAIVVVVASMAVIWVADPPLEWSHSRLLTLRPAAYVGDISYSVYLWHWPLIILLPYVTDHALTTVDKLSILLATIGLSALTKRFVEDPVRLAQGLGLKRPRTTFAYAAAAAVLLTLVCVGPRVAVARDTAQAEQTARRIAADAPPCFGAAARDPQATGCPNPDLAGTIVPTPAAAAQDWPQLSRCNAPMEADPLVPCRFGTDRGQVPHIAVVGDSHARVLMSTVQRMVDTGLVTADMLVIGGCPWSTTAPNLADETGRRCADFRRRLDPLLQRTAKDYDAVLTTARISTLRGDRAQKISGFSQAWAKVTRLGVPVVVVRDNPGGTRPEENPNLCLSEVAVSDADRCAFDRTDVLDKRFDVLTAAARRTPGAKAVDLTDFYCGTATCPVVIGGVNVYVDSNHVSVTYAKTLAPYLFRRLVDDGVVSP